MGVYPTHRGTAASFLPSPFGVGDSVISVGKYPLHLFLILSNYKGSVENKCSSRVSFQLSPSLVS